MFWVSFEMIYGFQLGIDILHDVSPDGYEMGDEEESFDLLRISLLFVFVHILYRR